MTTTNKSHIEAAIAEAEEFIKAAKAALNKMPRQYSVMGTRETGTMRRRSMDLSQALVKLRSSEND